MRKLPNKVLEMFNFNAIKPFEIAIVSHLNECHYGTMRVYLRESKITTYDG